MVILAVSIMSLCIACLPARLVFVLLRRRLYFRVLTAEVKKNIMGNWKRCRKIGTVIGSFMLFVFFCWLTYFIFENDDEKEKDWALSAYIILAWVLVILPGMRILHDFLVVTIMRQSSRLDEF